MSERMTPERRAKLEELVAINPYQFHEERALLRELAAVERERDEAREMARWARAFQGDDSAKRLLEISTEYVEMKRRLACALKNDGRVVALESRNAALVEAVEGLDECPPVVPQFEYDATRAECYEDGWAACRAAALAAADAAVSGIQPCGHPRSAIVSTDEGTHHCGACENEQKGTPDGE